MNRLFLDANILFSHAYRPRSFSAFWAESENGLSRLCTSRYAKEEARRNLASKRPQALSEFDTLLTVFEFVPEAPPEWTCAVSLAAKDKPILGAALLSKCHYLITGDRRDFGHLLSTQVDGLWIMTPKDYFMRQGYR